MSEANFGLAQWRQYPLWVRGPARIEGDVFEGRVVLDESRAETYYIYETVDISFELAHLSQTLDEKNTDGLLAFIRRFGLLWHGASDLGTGKCSESVVDIWAEAKLIALLMKMYTDIRDALNTGVAGPLRDSMKEFLEGFSAYPPVEDDDELMDQASVYLAEAINIRLKDCRAGIASSTQLAVQPRGPDRFLLSDYPPDLLTAAYAHFRRNIVDRAPMKECPGCGRRFIPESGKQKYHSKSCASTNRWRRWKDNQA